MMQSDSVIYVSNAGVLVNLNGKKILIDGFCMAETPLYKNPPVEIKEQMIRGIPPFDNIDIMLVTHHHSDHFDPISTGEFLEQNRETIIISTREVISRINGSISYQKAANTIALKPLLDHGEKIKVSDINIEIFSMIHEGKEYEHISNYAYLIENGRTVLHVGDSGPSEQNYRPHNLNQRKIDLLIAPFPYVGLPTARKIISEYINPKKIAVVHMPYPEMDSFGWISTTKKSYERVKNEYINTEFLEELGSSMII